MTMDNNTMTIIALAVAVLVGFALLALYMKKVIRKDTLEQIVETVKDMPVTMGSGLFGKIYEYSRAAVLTVEQLVKTGQITKEDQARKDKAMEIVEQAAKVDEVPFGAAESEMASMCIEAAVQQLPRNQQA